MDWLEIIFVLAVRSLGPPFPGQTASIPWSRDLKFNIKKDESQGSTNQKNCVLQMR